jgi:hypothetical protein
LAFKGEKPMKAKSLLFVALFACGPAFAQQVQPLRDVAAQKVEETERGSPYLSETTTAFDDALDRAAKRKAGKDDTPPEWGYTLRRTSRPDGSFVDFFTFRDARPPY